MDPLLLDQAKKALDKAKVAMMGRPSSAFIATVCFNMKHLWSEDVTTACTDGRHIWFNPHAFLALTPEQRLSRLLHETWHPALLHMVRMGNRDKHRWNAACDYFINNMLIKAGHARIDTWLYDPKYDGLSSEEIYDLLPTMPEDHPEYDLTPPPDGQDPMPVEDLEHHLVDVVAKARIQSQMFGDQPGTIPGEVELLIDQLLSPKLPWQRILQKFLSQQVKGDFTWTKPNRRFFPQYYLPSNSTKGLEHIAAGVDISLSVSDAEFKQQYSEIYQIMRQFQPKELTLIQFDTQLQHIDRLRSLQDLEQVQFNGRGGTRIRPLIEWAKENRPNLLLVFSDGEFHHHPEDPGVPVVWLIYNNPGFTAPYGKVVHFEI